MCVLGILEVNDTKTHPIVRAYDSYIGKELSLNVWMEKLVKKLSIRERKTNPCESTIVMNESDEILVINMENNKHHTSYITLY